MTQTLKVLAIGLALTLPFVSARDDDDDDDEQYEMDAKDAEKLADQVVMQISGPQLPSSPQAQLLQQRHPAIPAGLNAVPAAAAPHPQKADVKADAKTAKEAAKVARHAAKLANKVAEHSIKVVGHSKHALKHALGALHDARVESSGLDKQQKDTLKKAEAHLREATKAADHGQLKKVKDAHDVQKEKMEHDLNKKDGKSEREHMRHEIEELREKLKEKHIEDKDIDQALHELEEDLEKHDGPINDESKAELERLRRLIDSLEAPEKVEDHKDEHDESHDAKDAGAEEAPVPVETQGLDIDTQMPYGELEPFGREDTAQELTEDSITESNQMVDQLERAEVAEEKRSVFRALTRLRGAAITSFDGIARSQTGNIDEYNKIHRWRSTHPLHHLADEESDVSKWAFPQNAD